MPVPAPAVVAQLPGIETQLGWKTRYGNVCDDRDLWPVLWKANQAVAEAYGLGPAELGHIISTFPVYAKKHPEFHAFLQAQLANWAAERR
jgi:hypothetical protein